MGVLGTAIKNLVASKGATFLDGAKGIIEKFKADPTKVAELDAEFQKLTLQHETDLKEIEIKSQEIAQKEYEAMLADTANAREMNIKIQGDRPSWLSKNVAYMIDIFILLIWGFVTCYLLARMLNFISKDARVDLTAILALWGGITAMATTVINYHRGSSQSSRQKDDVIQKIAQS